ncbi:hypothetical protein [Comamonas sp. JC664]|uniref:hypothetical protein n=1 Tax=Comamonas sp. JC664 TaxID=2801917 RepID=UPI00174A92D8|nr:hypothetical protein [Comamonas sp. JC664]MBL0698921.1 hypothetical protein [Comamonas sp. JC664]GHG79557.1 hypothetical protein GCM10012319_31540 [Comamonas sp. KCTC 72670]
MTTTVCVPEPLPVPEVRRWQVDALVRSTPPAERGLLRLRLYEAVPDDQWTTSAGRGVKLRCVVCWTPRALRLANKEVADRTVATCRHPRCDALWERAGKLEEAVHESAKARLLAALAAGQAMEVLT